MLTSLVWTVASTIMLLARWLTLCCQEGHCVTVLLQTDRIITRTRQRQAHQWFLNLAQQSLLSLTQQPLLSQAQQSLPNWPNIYKFASCTVYCRSPVGSMEGPRQVSDYLWLGFCVLRVPWYDFCCLECKNIAYIVDFLRWAIWPPPRLIKDSETPVWWGLRQWKPLCELNYFWQD